MSICHPVARELVARDFPAMLKGGARSGLARSTSRPKRKRSLRQRSTEDARPSRVAPPPSTPERGAPTAGSITFDELATRARIEHLDAYMHREVMHDDRFTCASESACRSSVSHGCSFHPGQMSHIGTHYDAAIDDVHLRVVIIGMSYGTDHELVSLDARREMVLGVARPGRTLNPHMKGTVLALRAAFGLPTGDLDVGNEYLGEPRPENHLFNAFALVNCLLCSARKEGKKDHGTQAMRTACRRHLLATVGILEPSMIIVQGQPPLRVLGRLIRWDEGHVLGRLDVEGTSSVVCAFAHPSARGSLGWSSPARPYFREVVLPAIAEARLRLGIGDPG